MTTLYIDESKSRGYTIVVAAVLPGNTAALRRDVAALRKAGQRRVHFVHERDSRRREILSRFTELGVSTRVIHAPGLREAEGRERCLQEIVALAREEQVDRIVLERDDSLVDSDRRILYRELDRRNLRDEVSYVHERPADEPLLWIPDAIAWSFARGGDWNRRIQPLVSEVRRVS